MNSVFADHAWLGPGRFARRVLVEFDRRIMNVQELGPGETVPESVQRLEWLIPGLVNAHCHLEYTWLENAGLPRGRVAFGEWMRAIMSRRPADERDRERQLEAMREGARRLLAGGCTTVFDSTTDGVSAAILQEAKLRHFLFYEVLGLSQLRAELTWDAALQNLAKEKWQRRLTVEDSSLLAIGLNPHAPYSVGEWLRERLRSDEAAGLQQAWHLAETLDEEELFRSGTGSIAEFFRDVGLPMPWEREGRQSFSDEAFRSAAGRRCHLDGAGSEGWSSSYDFLRATGQLDRCGLVFHGNELSLEDAGFFRAPRGIVHCPGTHRWFERSPVSLRQWLDAGVNVCLGTDSLASAETLSMLDVVRMTLEDHPDVTADEVLTMACVNPWRVQGIVDGDTSADYGRGITVGALADLVGISVDGPETASATKAVFPLRQILTSPHGAGLSIWVGGAIDLNQN